MTPSARHQTSILQTARADTVAKRAIVLAFEAGRRCDAVDYRRVRVSNS